jgi:hypothetical protein
MFAPMHALPPSLRVALAAVLLVSIFVAFLGPPARKPRPHLARRLVALIVMAYAAAALAMAGGAQMASAALAAGGVEIGCLAAWLGRNRGRGGEDPPDGGEPRDPDGPEPIDWDAFDRARAGWGRHPREPVA